MNKWQMRREEAKDRARELTVPRLLARAVFFGTLGAILMWGPWPLMPRLLICAGGVLAYMAVSYSTPLRRHM
jgi:hypothetical protein